MGIVQDLASQMKEKWKSFLLLGGLSLFLIILTHKEANVAMNLVLLVCAGLVIAHDYDNYGPTVALQNGAIPAVVAWIVVWPLSGMTAPLFDSITVLGAILVCIGVIAALVTFLGPLGLLLGALFSFFCYGAYTYLSFVLSHILGTVLIFLVVMMFVRGMLQKVEELPNVVRVDAKSEEFTAQSRFFFNACEPWAHKYPFKLELKNIYRRQVEVDAPTAPKRGGNASNTSHLFHGTPWDSGKGILSDGFRKPAHSGMFGKGIYFADCPLKSWRYCFPSKFASQHWPGVTGRGGLILMCLVELGEQRMERQAQPQLDGYQAGFWERVTGRYRGAYDSVVGMTEEDGGALRVPEYVIYDPKQARVDYVFEVIAHYTS